MPTWFTTLVLVLVVFMAVRLVWFLYAATRYHRRAGWEPEVSLSTPSYQPRVSVIVPAYNESLGIAHCLRGMGAQTYADFEVIVVDDGSTDDTAAIARSIAMEPGLLGRLTVISKANGGKASALNHGILEAGGEIIVTVDSDSVLEADALEHLIRPFADPSVGAVGGNVRVAQPRGFLGHHQMVEYVVGLMLQRSAFADIDAMQVMSGAIGAFRHDVLQSVGGYSSDTVTEDFDITLAVWKTGYRVVFNPKAIAWTEGPSSYKDLLSQRIRWTFGGFQTLRKYRTDQQWEDSQTWEASAEWPDRNRRIARIGLPYFAFGPWFDVAISILFITTMGFVIASGSWWGFIMFYAGMALVMGAVGIYALHLDQRPKWWAVFAITMTLWYTHMLALATLVAGYRRLTGHQGKWRKLERRGSNALPASISRPLPDPVSAKPVAT
jgi:cellulose synthase/poly-beta-1,6-N-acetylglucosamine synthase-like glycosyltransferase